ncbi:MAG: ATP-binding protein [Candidatus Hadarchaeales archaeon]
MEKSEISENPFTLTPRRQELWSLLAPIHENVAKELLKGAGKGGVFVVTGEPGVGKTTLLERVGREMRGRNSLPVYVPCGALVEGKEDLLRAILSGLYLKAEGSGMELYGRLRELAGSGRVVLLLDDLTSSSAPPKVLGETVRMLSDLPGFSLILVGTPKEMGGILKSCRALASRILGIWELEGIGPEEAWEMLKRRGKKAGIEVDRKTALLLHRAGRGIPREILKLAMKAWDLSVERGISFGEGVRILLGKKRKFRKSPKRPATR